MVWFLKIGSLELVVNWHYLLSCVTGAADGAGGSAFVQGAAQEAAEV